MGKYEVKNEISSDIKNDIKSLLERLNTVIIDSEDYKTLYTNFDIKNRELQIVDSIKESNYDSVKKESKSIDSKFSFMKKLDDNSVDKLIELTKMYNNNGFYDYDKTFKVPTFIRDIKKFGISIDVNVINDVDDVNLLISKLNELKDDLLDRINNLKYIYNNFILGAYLSLKNDVESGKVSSDKDLNALKEISYPSNFISKITELKREYVALRRKSSDKKAKEVFQKILKYQEYLYQEISKFVDYKLNSIMKFNSEEFKIMNNVIYKYYRMLDLLEEILNELSKTIKNMEVYVDIYDRAKKSYISNLKLLGIENVDLEEFRDFDKDKYKKYVAYMNVYDRINKSEMKENDDFKLRRKIDDKN